MKWALFILIFLPTALQAQEYEVKDRCMGGGSYAIVVEFNDQYYVVETPEYFQHNWVVIDLMGIVHGGTNLLYYANSAGATKSMQVRVLSRYRWKYAGLIGASSVCKQITQGAFRRFSI